MVSERTLLGSTEWLPYPATTLWLWLPLLLLCHWFPYVVVIVSIMHAAQLVVQLSVKLPRRRKLLIWAALLTPLVVCASALGWYTFSGPQARHLWYRPLGIALSSVFISGALTLPFLLFIDAVRGARRLLYPPLLLVATLASLALNRFVLPDEYEPLHVLLAFLALLGASGFGAISARWWKPTRRTGWGVACLTLALSIAFACMLVVSRSHVLSFLVYGKAVGARYLATRLDWDDAVSLTGASSPRLKPNLSANVRMTERARAERAAGLAPHIIVFSIDNVQADHVGCYGYTKHPTTPNIDALASEGMVFDRAYSWFPRTRMFLTSMLLGRAVPRFTEHDFAQSFRDQSLTRLLARRGYHVLLKGWFDAANHFKPDGYGVDTWMPVATEDPRHKVRGQPHVPMSANYRTLERHFERARQQKKPVFAWMHFLQPHPFQNEFLGDEKHGFGSSKVDAYDSAVAIADGYLPELRRLAHEYLEPDRPVYWVVMSDHGTGFSDTGGATQLEEGRNISEHFVHVPLIIAGPGLEGGRSDVLVSASIDTAATLLDLVGINPPPSYDGVSLLPVLGGYLNRSEALTRAVYLNYYGWHGMLHGAHKFAMYKGGASLVNLHEDPHEWRNIADTQPELVRQLDALTQQEQRRIELAFTSK